MDARWPSVAATLDYTKACVRRSICVKASQSKAFVLARAWRCQSWMKLWLSDAGSSSFLLRMTERWAVATDPRQAWLEDLSPLRRSMLQALGKSMGRKENVPITLDLFRNAMRGVRLYGPAPRAFGALTAMLQISGLSAGPLYRTAQLRSMNLFSGFIASAMAFQTSACTLQAVQAKPYKLARTAAKARPTDWITMLHHIGCKFVAGNTYKRSIPPDLAIGIFSRVMAEVRDASAILQRHQWRQPRRQPLGMPGGMARQHRARQLDDMHIHTHTYTDKCVYIYTCTYTHIYVYTYTHMHMCACTHIRRMTYTHMRMYAYTCIPIHVYTHINKYTHIHTHIHTHTHTYTHVHKFACAHIHTYTTYIYVRIYIYDYIIIYVYIHIQIRLRKRLYVNICVYICVYVYVHICVCLYLYMYICMHMYICIYFFIYIRTFSMDMERIWRERHGHSHRHGHWQIHIYK